MDKVSSNYKNYKIKYSKNDEIIKEILENDLLDLVMIFFYLGVLFVLIFIQIQTLSKLTLLQNKQSDL